MDKKYIIPKSFSEFIGSSRFILCVMVVVIHSRMISGHPVEADNWVLNFMRMMSLGISSVAVPIFMLFSGYLLCAKYLNGDNIIASYRDLLKKKSKTLLLPYIIWNVIGLAYIVLRHYFNAEVYVPNLFEALVSIPEESTLLGFPADGPLWFVRDLIIFNLISPLIFWIMNKLGKWGFVFASVYYLVSALLPHYPFSSINTFLVGMSLCYIDLSKLDVRWKSIVLLPTICLFIYLTFPLGGGNYLYEDVSLMPLFVLLFAWSMYLISISYKESTKQKLNDLSKYSFFIYASHGMYANLMTKTITAVLCKVHIGYSTSLLFGYVATPIIIVALSILICRIMIKYCPPLYRILCGGR